MSLLKLNPAALDALQEAEIILARAGLPSVSQAYTTLAAAGMVLDGRKRNKADVAKRVASYLEPLRPGNGLTQREQA